MKLKNYDSSSEEVNAIFLVNFAIDRLLNIVRMLHMLTFALNAGRFANSFIFLLNGS